MSTTTVPTGSVPAWPAHLDSHACETDFSRDCLDYLIPAVEDLDRRMAAVFDRWDRMLEDAHYDALSRERLAEDQPL